MYMVMMIALTLGFTVVRPRVLLMACQTMHGYPGRSHIKIFAVSKIFSLAGVDVELLFYIYLAYGIRG